MKARNLDEVLTLLDDVIDEAIQERNPHGIFTALYQQMTLRVKQGIEAGVFDDGPRMDDFDTRFANRYFEALDQHRAGLTPARSWRVAFAAAHQPSTIALQHMLLGVNAHINFDLPIAAAETAPDNILSLQDDFERINTIISALLDEAQEILNVNSRGMRLIDLLGGDLDEWLAAFSIQKMRLHAWEEARELVTMTDSQQERAIRANDRRVASLGRLLIRPPRLLQAAVDLINLGEQGRTVAIIKGLRCISSDVACLTG